MANRYSQFKLVFSLCLCLFLAACMQVKRDGPPAYDVDVSHIPDAVPKVEKLSKYGNRPFYNVFGKRYHVMRTSKHYREIGVASWYGTMFNHHHTSNGERYDMLAMTAAHKNLPLPTYVQVTNLANGKRVVVKVNDRGPFEAHRIIDLSWAAAKKLGMLAHGTAMVEVKAIDPLRYDKNSHVRSVFLVKNKHFPALQIADLSQHAKVGSRQHFLQVGVFHNKAYAEKLRLRLQPEVAYPIRVIRQAKHLYKVEIGPIKETASLATTNSRLQELGVKSEVLG